MPFIEISPKNKTFRIKKQYFLNRSLNNKEVMISDGAEIYNPSINCPECSKGTISLGKEGAFDVESYKLSFGVSKLKQFGGGGVLFKLLECSSCKNTFYLGIGYDEPNYGRAQFFIHTILKIEEEDLARSDFYGNMGEPTTAKEFFSKYGVYPPNYDENGNRIKE